MSRIAEQMEAQLVTPRLSRRAALGTFAAGAALLSTPRLIRARQPDAPAIARKARNVIFMVADGMSLGTLTLADLYARKMQDRRAHWISLMGERGSRRALQTTHSADGPVTDSAAAAAAWGSGFKHTNGAINITPDHRQQLPILVHAAQNGKKTGLVTTTRVTHATPSGFCVNIPVRDMEGDAAKQQVERGINVLLGGGLKYYTDELLARAASNGAVVVKDAAGLAGVDSAAATKQLIGIFARHHVPFVTDRADTVPSLPAMATKALDILSRGSEGFVLQIEGGRVDHAAHSSDAYSLIREMIEFDETIAAVTKFLEGRDDTLLIITTDHGNSNPGLTLYAKRGQEAFDKLAAPEKPRKSFEWIYDQLPAKAAAEDKIKVFPDLVEQGTGIKLGESETKVLTACLKGQRATPFAAANVWTFVLGSLLADHFGVAFVSPNHTADMVELLARGPGSEAIPPVVDNTDLHAVMVAALGLAPARPLPDYDELVVPVKPKTDD